MPDEKELAEFQAWKEAKEKAKIFDVLDEWAERSGLADLLKGAGDGDDDGADDQPVSLRDAAARIADGKPVTAPKPKPKAPPEPEPEPEPKSFASRLGLTGG